MTVSLTEYSSRCVRHRQRDTSVNGQNGSFLEFRLETGISKAGGQLLQHLYLMPSAHLRMRLYRLGLFVHDRLHHPHKQ